ncbi:MAG: hypothetical protein M1324_03225 [Patescibacteria group bacterium]|nr:hypothetical protein [Patescibacteria group bacterium]
MWKWFKWILLGLGLIIVLFVTASGLKHLKQKGEKSDISISQKCPDPFVFQLPADLNLVTAILYPGQIRGGDYKAHGGFRFDNSKSNDITVTAPSDAEVIDGGKYIVQGQPQYVFDFAHPCGVRYRLGHLLTLSAKFQDIADKLPQNGEGDSRTFEVRPPVQVKQGEIIATGVGIPGGGFDGQDNTFFDWGVYDYRQQNEASKAPDWPTRYISQDQQWSQFYNSDTYKYGVCLFDWLSPADRSKVLSLPSADGEHGKQSDFCQNN